MAPVDAASSLEFARFAVGQPVRRGEDAKLLTGRGTYTDDIDLPGQAHAWVLRSPHAHGRIRAIDTAAAREMPGVLAIWTAADLAPFDYGQLRSQPVGRNRDGTPMRETRVRRLPTTGSAMSAIRSRSWSPKRASRPATRAKPSRSTSSRCRP